MRSKALHLSGAVTAVVLALILSGCNSKPAGGDVMAKVNGKKILRAEVERMYNAQLAGAPQQPSGEQADALRLNLLKSLIDEEILRQRAEKAGLLATDDEVQRRITEIKAGNTKEEFEKRLKDNGRSMQDLENDIRRALTVDKLINKEILSKIEISDADVTAYYNAHKSEFNLIEPQYQLAQIVVTTSPGQVNNRKNNKANSEAEARAKMQQILNRLESGEDFATVATDWSEDANTAPNGGDIGVVPESALKNDPGMLDMIKKLKPGQYSSVIGVVNPATKRVEAYRLVQLLAKEPAGQHDLNNPNVQQEIRNRLRQTREQLLKLAYFDVVRDEAKIENYYAELILKNSGAKR